MPSLYDAIEVRGQLRYRLNKNFIGADKVPENIKSVLTANNIVDENGMVVVDQKNEAAQAPTDENQEDIDSEEGKTSLNRVDQDPPEDGDKAEDPADDGSEPDTPDQDPPQTDPVPPAAPPVVDDSANDEEGDDENETSTSDTDKDPTAPVAGTTPTPDPKTPEPAAKEKTPRKSTRTAAPDEPVEKFKSKVPQSSPGMGFPRKNGKTVDIFDLKTPHTKVQLVGGLPVPLSEESYKTKTETQIKRRLEELGIETIDFDVTDDFGSPNAPGLLLEDDDEEDDINLG
jgi:hypothetical protein